MSRKRSCGADIPVRETLRSRMTNGASVIWTAVTRSFAIFVAALREVFDESAYQRFLEKGCLESSVNAYAAFQRQNEQSKSRRPRCC